MVECLGYSLFFLKNNNISGIWDSLKMLYDLWQPCSGGFHLLGGLSVELPLLQEVTDHTQGAAMSLYCGDVQILRTKQQREEKMKRVTR